ncbi:hypothetical protein IFM89_010779 [Coptis chinensis]|uniref:Uncharacterized protein n=1 Tax=Coptis chinensis TaxID=261450 RepID=A0A835IUL3_9MAGN|nr:hypothetical protein IFM89_010779 [Coptis chinensis]
MKFLKVIDVSWSLFSQASTPTNTASAGKQDGVRMPKELFVPWTLYFLKRDVDSSSKRSTIRSKGRESCSLWERDHVKSITFESIVFIRAQVVYILVLEQLPQVISSLDAHTEEGLHRGLQNVEYLEALVSKKVLPLADLQPARMRRSNASLGNTMPASSRDASLQSVSEVSESVGPEAVHDGPTEEQQINSEVDSGSINPAFLDALPEELCAEVLSTQHGQAAQPSNSQPHQIGYLKTGESQVFQGSCTILSDDVGWGLRRLSSTITGLVESASNGITCNNQHEILVLGISEFYSSIVLRTIC